MLELSINYFINHVYDRYHGLHYEAKVGILYLMFIILITDQIILENKKILSPHSIQTNKVYKQIFLSAICAFNL